MSKLKETCCSEIKRLMCDTCQKELEREDFKKELVLMANELEKKVRLCTDHNSYAAGMYYGQLDSIRCVIQMLEEGKE